MDRQSRWQAKVIDSVHSGRESSQLLQTYINEFNQGLLYSLKYQGMTDRYELIQSAHQDTFEWIFDAKNEMKEQPSFIEWLEGDSQLYWITGKPGAGKSTLMKFIAGNERTRGHLATWAGSQSFHILSFYFWSSGHDELQMSLEGLLRTLLHSALEQIPSLIPKAFMERFETFMLFGSNVTWTDPFRWSELLQSFRYMAKEATSTDRLVFFIDGLDEFHGKPSSVIDLIHSLTGSNVKVCVSSRPYIQFEEAFKTAPSLRVEDSTQSDIKSFVESQLTSNSGFLTLQKLTPDTAASLIQEITTKASGVFLWVFLVTDLLLEGLTEGERLSELQKRLNSLPSDLEALFWKILQSLDSGKFRRASQLFQIHLAATKAKGVEGTRGSDSRYQVQTRRSRQPRTRDGLRSDTAYDVPAVQPPFLDRIRGLTLLDLSFADEDMDMIFDMPVGDFRKGEAEARAEMMRRRLTTCCKCLLQVHKDPKSSLARSTVLYLHQTARGFIEKPEVWKKLLEATENTFDVNQSLFLMHLARLKRSQYHEVGSGKIWLKAARCIDYALRVDDFPPGQSFLLNEIDFACAQLTARNLKIDRKSWENFLAFNDRESAYWTLSMPQTFCGMTFLHLAVKYQLVSYVEETLESCVRTFKRTLPRLANAEFIRKDFRFHMSDLLTLALFNYDILPWSDDQPPRRLLGIEKRKSKLPNLELVRMLLESGADLSAPAPRENASIWEAARRRHQGNSALLGVLKRYRT